MPYLQIYKNKPNAIFTHSVLKGEDLYEVNILPDKPMRWRYIGKIDPKVYQISGTLISKPSLKMVTILQRDLQPKRINESYQEGSVWRLATQEWLKEFIDNEGYIEHKSFISFSFDDDAGGQDTFGGREVLIEFDQEKLLKQGKEQDLGQVQYDEWWMSQHPEVCGYITGHKTKEAYYRDHDLDNDRDAYESQEMTWESYIESFEHEQEIVLRSLSDEKGLIKSIVFNKPADMSLINRLQRKGIPFRLKEGLKNDPQKKLKFEPFK